MNISMQKVVVLSLMLCILSTQGMLNFYLLSWLGNGGLKSAVPPSAILMLFTFVLLYKNKNFVLKGFDVVLIAYLLALLVTAAISGIEASSVFYAFRELVLLFALVLLAENTQISESDIKAINRLLFVLVVLNLAAVFYTYLVGPEVYMKTLTGRYFWPKDPKYFFTISTFYDFWRSPGLVGQFADLGLFAVLSFFIFIRHKASKLFIGAALLLTLVALSRTAYVPLVIYVLYYLLTGQKVLKFLIKYYYVLFLLLVPAFWILFQKKVFSPESLLMRFEFWNDIIHQSDLSWFFGGRIGTVGQASELGWFSQVLDSYWIYLFLSSGIIGIILAFNFFFERVMAYRLLSVVAVGFFVSGLFTTLTQSYSFLLLFPFLFLKLKPETDDC